VSDAVLLATCAAVVMAGLAVWGLGLMAQRRDRHRLRRRHWL
jgi:hypothetical protein